MIELRSVYTERDRGFREGMVEIKQTKVVYTERYPELDFSLFY